MKKSYGKPKVSFEDFAFSSNIAAGCGANGKLHAEGICGAYATFTDPASMCQYYDNGVYIFLDMTMGCFLTPQDFDPNKLCYHNSTGEARMFSS